MNHTRETRSNTNDDNHHYDVVPEFSPIASSQSPPPAVVRESTASLQLPQRVTDHPLMMTSSSLSSNHQQSIHSNRNLSGHDILVPPSSTTIAATVPTEEATVLLLETPVSPYPSLYDDRTTYTLNGSQRMNGSGNHQQHDSIHQDTASLSNQATLQMHHSHRVDDHDARYAATLNEEEELLLALKISAYECQRPTVRYHTTPGSEIYSTADRHVAHDPYAPPPPTTTTTNPYSWSSSHNNNETQQATVVEISAHFDDDDDRRATTTTATSSSMSPFYMSAMGAATSTTTNPRMGDDTVRAEWIGSSSVATNTIESPTSSNMIYATAAAATTTTTPSVAMLNDQHNDNDETYYEVAVIDSAPMEKQDETIVYTEEARIVDIREQNDDNQDGMEDDRKPAAIRKPKKKPSSNRNDSHMQEPPLLHPPQNGFNNGQLPVISEQQETTMPPPPPPRDMAATAQVVSIQMESDLHPLQRTTENDSEAELVGLDHTFYGSAAAAVNLDDSSSADQNYHHRATSLEPNQIVMPSIIDGAIVANSAVDILSIQDEDAIHPSDLDAIEALNNGTTATTSAELVGSLNYMDVNDNTPGNRPIPSVCDNSYILAIASSSCLDTTVVSTVVAEQEGDVVAIREEDEVHPLEFDENAVESTASAELIGSINPLNLDSMAFRELTDTSSAVALAVVTEPSGARADVVVAESSIPDETLSEPVIVATAFTDPHQPLVETLNEGDDAPWGVNADEEIARTLQEEEDVARTFQENLHAAEILQDEDVARQLQNSTDDNNHVDTAIVDRNGDSSQPENVRPDLAHGPQIETPIQANQGSVATTVSTPEPRQVHQTTREVSHDYSTTSETTASSSNLTNSVCATFCSDMYVLLYKYLDSHSRNYGNHSSLTV